MKTQTAWNLLLVEDDEDDFFILQDMLAEIRRENYHLSWANNYTQGIQELHSRQWDAVLVDYDLGTTTGLEFIREALEQGHKEPLIMITGRGSYELDLEASEAGAADYISKLALNPPLLERAIRHAIERRHIEENLQSLVDERTEELQTYLEELSVMNEELKQKSDEVLLAQENETDELKLYRARQQTFPSAYIVTDTEARILKADYGAALMLGMAASQLPGRMLASYIDLKDRSQFARSLVYVTPTQPIHRLDLHLKSVKRVAAMCCFTVYRIDERPAPPELRWLIHYIGA